MTLVSRARAVQMRHNDDDAAWKRTQTGLGTAIQKKRFREENFPQQMNDTVIVTDGKPDQAHAHVNITESRVIRMSPLARAKKATDEGDDEEESGPPAIEVSLRSPRSARLREACPDLDVVMPPNSSGKKKAVRVHGNSDSDAESPGERAY